MTQITATLEKGADPDLIRQFFENVRGVVSTSVSFTKEEEKKMDPPVHKDLSAEKKDWLDKLNRLYNNVDRKAIDLNDEKTRYILSK